MTFAAGEEHAINGAHLPPRGMRSILASLLTAAVVEEKMERERQGEIINHVAEMMTDPRSTDGRTSAGIGPTPLRLFMSEAPMLLAIAVFTLRSYVHAPWTPYLNFCCLHLPGNLLIFYPWDQLPDRYLSMQYIMSLCVSI